MIIKFLQCSLKKQVYYLKSIPNFIALINGFKQEQDIEIGEFGYVSVNHYSFFLDYEIYFLFCTNVFLSNIIDNWVSSKINDKQDRGLKALKIKYQFHLSVTIIFIRLIKVLCWFYYVLMLHYDRTDPLVGIYANKTKY